MFKMASAGSTNDENDENNWKIACFRSRSCRFISNQINESISETIANNDAWSEQQKELFKKRFTEIYENDLSNSVLINGQNFNSVDDDDGENDTMEFEPINQEVQHQLVYDLPLGLNDAINVTAKRRKTYPPICKHFLKKELRIRCRCMERLKVSVSSNSRIKGFPTQPTDDCNETKASLVSTMGEMLELMKDLPSSVEKAKGLEQLQLLELKTKPSKRRRQSSKPKPLIPKSLEEEVIVSEANNNTYHDNEGFLKVCNVLLGRSCFISSMSSTYLKEGCPSNLRKSGSPGDS